MKTNYRGWTYKVRSNWRDEHGKGYEVVFKPPKHLVEVVQRFFEDRDAWGPAKDVVSYGEFLLEECTVKTAKSAIDKIMEYASHQAPEHPVPTVEHWRCDCCGHVRQEPPMADGDNLKVRVCMSCDSAYADSAYSRAVANAARRQYN